MGEIWMCIMCVRPQCSSTSVTQGERLKCLVSVSLALCSQAIWVQLGPERQETHSLTDTHTYTNIFFKVRHTPTVPPSLTHTPCSVGCDGS